ncbi:hypothetical protein Hanom_Chr06g00483661 [Helianthus anomalus]
MSQPRQPIDASLGLCGSSCGSGSSHVISGYSTVCQCELLYTFSKRSGDTPIAIGQAFPSSDRDLGNDISMHEHCVKVLVDEVYSLYLGIPVLDETFVEDKITRMEDTVLHIIQWPRKLIKILDVRCDFNPSVEAYILEHSSEVNVQFGSNDVYFGSNELYDDNVFLANSDALINTRMSAFEEDQTHHVEPQRATTAVVQKPKRKQSNPKQPKGKQRKAKGNEKQAQPKVTDQDKQAEKVELGLKLIQLRPKWFKDMVHRLKEHIKDDWKTQLTFNVDETMFPMELGPIHVEPESLLALNING